MITALTSLENKLYVASRASIAVYQIDTYHQLNSLVQPNIGYVSDMASSETHRCIYIADSVNRRVHKLNTTTESDNSLTSWSVNYGPDCLSVDLDSNVIVTFRYWSKINVFTSDGEFVKEIPVPANSHPFHAIQLTADMYLVSLGVLNNKIITVNSNGTVQLTFNGTGMQGNHVHRFERLAMINGRILVTEANNGWVYMLSLKLRYIDRVLVSSFNKMPTIRMSVEKTSGLLYVADSSSTGGILKVYSID